MYRTTMRDARTYFDSTVASLNSSTHFDIVGVTKSYDCIYNNTRLKS